MTDPRELAESQFANPQVCGTAIDLVTRYATDVPLVVDGLVSALAPRRPDARILEVGFGTGWLLELLCERYPSAHIYGLDLSPAMVAAVRDANRGAHVGCGDMQRAPFADSTFDAVASCCALYFADDIDAALVELKRLAAKGGTVVVNTVSPDNLKELDAFSREVLEETPLEDITPRFDMDTGLAPMERHFSGVERVEWRGEMVLPDAACFVDYWSSFHHNELARHGKALLDRANRFAERHCDAAGRVRLTRASGAFVVRSI